MMRAICEAEINGRVVSLAFHRRRSWMFVGLYSGEIRVFDYLLKEERDAFIAHIGKVSAIDLHKWNDDLVVSGGDDTEIRGWSSETKTLIFTLLGHQGPIRTVKFHDKHPWIVSASDDMAIRIWNWESQTCISLLTGHESPVQCASFHPKLDIVVSASMDQTVRLWDIGALKKHHILSLAHVVSRMGQMVGALFNGSDVIVLQGHRGVIWASFHPTLLLIASAEDHRVNLWSIKDETRTWEMDTLGVHMDNVSCVMFLPNRPDILVSTSVDGSIRVWDTTNRTELQTFHREHYRFCSLAVHPDMNLLAAGHDSGTMVFKLPTERPPFALSSDFVFHFKDGFLWRYEFSVKTARSEVFIATNLFAVLEKSSNQVLVRNLNNEVVYTTTLPMTTDAIFYAGTGTLLCRSEDKVFIFDLEKGQLLGDLETPDSVRYIVWSVDKESVALLSKHTIILASKKLVHRYTLNETTPVESGAWDDSSVFLYTTLNHIKYCRPNGNSGIVRTLDVPIYIAHVSENSIFCLDVHGESMIISIADAEYRLGVIDDLNDDDVEDEWEFACIEVEEIELMGRFRMVDEGGNEDGWGVDEHGNGWDLVDPVFFRRLERQTLRYQRRLEHMRKVAEEILPRFRFSR